jgi:hypothetical protein
MSREDHGMRFGALMMAVAAAASLALAGCGSGSSSAAGAAPGNSAVSATAPATSGSSTSAASTSGGDASACAAFTADYSKFAQGLNAANAASRLSTLLAESKGISAKISGSSASDQVSQALSYFEQEANFLVTRSPALEPTAFVAGIQQVGTKCGTVLSPPSLAIIDHILTGK